MRTGATLSIYRKEVPSMNTMTGRLPAVRIRQTRHLRLHQRRRKAARHRPNDVVLHANLTSSTNGLMTNTLRMNRYQKHVMSWCLYMVTTLEMRRHRPTPGVIEDMGEVQINIQELGKTRRRTDDRTLHNHGNRRIPRTSRS